MKNRDPHLDEYARARLAYVTAGRPPLVLGPRYLAEPLDASRDAQPDEDEPEADWLQEPVLDASRLDQPRLLRRASEFARGHLKAIAVVLLAALVLTAVLAQRSRPTTIALEEVQAGHARPAPAATPLAPGAISPTAAPTPARLKVHVVGAVARPGVVSLPSGARVQDAVTAAGGLSSSAAIGEMNLAAPVTDGDQVLVGTQRRPRGEVRHAGEAASVPAAGGPARGAGAAGSGAVGASSGAVLDLNSATAEQLDTLPGVGPVTAQRILEWRTSHGRFSRVEELQEVDGIGPKTYANLASHVRV